MKTSHLFLTQAVLSVALVVLTGCISISNFSAWNGPAEFEGQGGAFTTKDGIDIYTAGTPNKRCRILGVINTSTMSTAEMMVLFGNGWSVSTLVKEAKRQGGDAVILADDRARILGWTSSGAATAYQTGSTATAYGSSQTSANVSRDRVAVLVKYLGNVQEPSEADMTATKKLIGHWLSERFAGKQVEAQHVEFTFCPDKKLIGKTVWTTRGTTKTNLIEGTYYVRNDKLFMAIPGEGAEPALFYFVDDELVIKPADMDAEVRLKKAD